MVPSAFVQLEKFPLTPNGKIDRHALPEPEFGATDYDRGEPLAGGLEESVAQVWRDVLGVETVLSQQQLFRPRWALADDHSGSLSHEKAVWYRRLHRDTLREPNNRNTMRISR